MCCAVGLLADAMLAAAPQDGASAGHWAFAPLREVAAQEHASGNPIDGFVAARLAAEGLDASQEAERTVLIRRLSFDLLGLPPSPDEVVAFVRDPGPDAYARLVDRMLASPHYGERWARHWLDVARYGESNGFEHDEPRPDAWRYRDWVIHALADGMPFDEFARRQIAGDVLAPDHPAAAVATGFLVAGAYDTVGQGQQSKAMRAVVRQDELEDIVGTTMQAFLGLTAQCARCHDHKFDPISQVEYYRLTAAFAGVRHGRRDVTPLHSGAGAVRDEILRLRSELTDLERPVLEQLRKTSDASGPVPLASWDFDRGVGDATLHGGARVERGALILDGKAAFAKSVPLTKTLLAKTLEAWVEVDGLDQRGGAAISVQTRDGNVFDAIVFGEQDPGMWMAGSDYFRRTRPFGGTREIDAATRAVHVAIVYDADGTITGYRDGKPYGRPYRTGPVVEFRAGEAQVLFGLRHGKEARPGRMLRGAIHRAQLHDRALSAEEVARSCAAPRDYVSEAELVAALTSRQREKRADLRERLAAARARLADAAKQLGYVVVPRPPEPAFVLKRGDPALRGRQVAPGGIAVLPGVDAELGLSADASDRDRRTRLAQWITGNPLFARVIVNRLWHHHFGAGIVDTPSDFGRSGGKPSHPLLLDWLASELIRSGHDLKHVHRLIVTSATYRQASKWRADCARKDADNRLLWRMAPRRLEAEAVRDAMLRISGRLDPTVGGKGYRDFEIKKRGATYSYPALDVETEGPMRRSIYRMWARGGRNGLLDTFDCPDPSTTAPRRASTTTPLQALALLNSRFSLAMVEGFAARVAREAGGDVDARIVRAYMLAYARTPDVREMRALRPLVTEHGLPALCRAVFNSDELVYVY